MRMLERPEGDIHYELCDIAPPWMEPHEPLMHMAPVARVCHQMLRLRLGRGNG